MGETAAGLLVPDEPELVLPPGQTPISSAKRIQRMRRLPATVGFVDDEVGKLAKALLVQYGPIAIALKELMLRQMAVEDFLSGEIELDVMQGRIKGAAIRAEPSTDAVPA